VDGRWQFPGIGEFQCYDKNMLEDLQRAAVDAGEPMWGYSGPHDAGNYNSKPWEAPFFQLRVGEFTSDYAHFFLVSS
jgi:beta-amylase